MFTEEIREWALNNFNIIWMSFDGMQNIQDYNRPLNKKYSHLYNGRTSSEILEDNVKWLIANSEGRDLMVGARVTITDKNIDKQTKMVDYFYDLGIRYVWTNPLFYSVGQIPVCKDEKKRKEYNFDMNLYLDEYVKAFHYAQDKGLFWGSFLSINFDGKSPYHCRCCTPLEAPHLTPDGYISACDMVVLGAEAYHMSPFIVGKWNSLTKTFDFDYTKIHALNMRKSTEMTHCQSCQAQLYCGGYCLGETVNESGKLDGQNPIKCNAIRRLLNEIETCDTYKYLHP